jgi:dienelactone hydrolase
MRSCALAALLLLATPALAQEAVTFEAADGVVVHADLYPHGGERARGAILLFHQAGANAGEYRGIAPRLAAQGFDALAVDQRMGGSMFGTTNRTMAGLTGPVMSFDAVLPDLAAALAYARVAWPDAPLLLWGSSYSADLVVALAADEPEAVAGVLAFSPVGLLRERDLLDSAAQVRAPVFITFASADDERSLAAALAAALPDGLATLDAPAPGTHGSMTLLPATNPAGWEAEWAAVEAFLARVAP